MDGRGKPTKARSGIKGMVGPPSPGNSQIRAENKENNLNANKTIFMSQQCLKQKIKGETNG